MAGKNPFDLGDGRGKKGPERPVRPVALTEAEQKEKLEGYMSIPKEYWPNLKYGTHLRYIETSGEFRGGGFVLQNPHDIKPRGSTTEKRFIKMMNNFSRQSGDHKEWIVAYEDIEYLYAKGSGTEMTILRDLRTAITGMDANVRRLAEYAKGLEKRIGALEKK